MTTFRSEDLFGSGPHRVTMGPRSLSLVPNFQLGEPGAGTTFVGVLEWEVVVEGCLIATTRASLWALRDAFAERISDEPAVGSLVLSDGREFSNMTMASYAETGAVVAGRVWSVGYKAVFRHRK